MPSSLTRDHPFPLAHSCPATSVGLRYGRARPPARGFSRGRAPAESRRVAPSLSPTSGVCPAWLDAAAPAPRSALPTPSPERTCSSARGDGISTVCPSPTPFGLGLGPTNPPRMDLPEEPSAIRGACFSQAVRYSCRHSHSPPLQPAFQPTFTADGDAPLPPRQTEVRGFGARLSPGQLSARAHSTSELLRTLSRMAASKPTSWLSGRPHILCH